jgi:hypothetical protein
VVPASATSPRAPTASSPSSSSSSGCWGSATCSRASSRARWHIATNPLGKIAVLAGTGWLTHYVFGASTIVGMIALCWSLVFKVIVIEQKAREMGKAHA